MGLGYFNDKSKDATMGHLNKMTGNIKSCGVTLEKDTNYGR